MRTRLSFTLHLRCLYLFILFALFFSSAGLFAVRNDLPGTKPLFITLFMGNKRRFLFPYEGHDRLRWSRGKCAGLWYPSSRVRTRPKPSDF